MHLPDIQAEIPHFQALSQNCEGQLLLASSRLSVDLSARPSALNNPVPTGWIFIKFDI
jgi:hypothetical protein